MRSNMTTKTMKICGGILLCFLAVGMGVNSEPITAWASFSTRELELVYNQHHNQTIYLVIRGTLSECINLNFTYDPPTPTIVPINDLIICPQLSTTYFPPSTSKLPITPTSTSITISTTSKTKQIPELEIHTQSVVWNGSVEVAGRSVGTTILGVKTDQKYVDVKEAFVRVSIIHTPLLDTLSDVIGWMYTLVWIFSWLPQIYLSWRRKSVEGLSLDNVSFNIIAYIYYTLYNLAFLYFPLIKAQFQERYPKRVNHVRLNDLFFASFSFLAEVLLGIMCLMYKRTPGQIVSWPSRLLVLGSILAVLVTCVLAAVHTIWWLDVFYLMSYLKLVFTPLKYIPQVFVNYKRKSTEGFSVKGAMIDFTGGVLSLAQMFLLSANNNDWLSLFTNFSKLGLGIVTLLFDTIYFLQHYCYHIRDLNSKKPTENKNISEHRRSDYQRI